MARMLKTTPHAKYSECTFTFDYAEYFDGYTDGTNWNGWDNVWVTPETRDEIAAYLEHEGDDAGVIAEVRALVPDADGLCSLANGHAAKVIS